MNYNKLKEQINQGNFFEFFEFLDDLQLSDENKSIYTKLRKEFTLGIAKTDIEYINRLKVFISGIKTTLDSNPPPNTFLSVNNKEYQKLIKLGNDYFEVEKPELALQTFKNAKEIFTSSYVLNWIGYLHKMSQNYVLASQAIQESLEITPDDYYAWYTLGTIDVSLGKEAKAIKSFQKSIEIKDDDKDVWCHLGAAYQVLGRPQDAIDAFQKSISISSDYHKVWNNLGNSYGDIGHMQEAVQAYQKATDIDPNELTY